MAGLLATRIFKVLLHDRSEYGDVPYLRECLKKQLPVVGKERLPQMYPGFLFKAGILPEFPTQFEQLIPAQVERLKQAAKLEARLMISNLSSLNGVRERRASVEAVSGRRLFRLWDSRFPNSETGTWWFSEGVYDTVRHLPPLEQKNILRDLMAVSRDWSNLDRVSFLALEAQEVPAIVAQGLPQRYYSKSMWHRFPERDSPEALAQRKDYYANLNAILQGGKSQFYLPWTPKHLVRSHAAL